MWQFQVLLFRAFSFIPPKCFQSMVDGSLQSKHNGTLHMSTLMLSRTHTCFLLPFIYFLMFSVPRHPHFTVYSLQSKTPDWK